MNIKIKQFIDDAIKNGYNETNYEWWDWIRENLKELDFVFKTEEYKKQNGIKYKCLPFLFNKEKDDISFLEEKVLEKIWYLNNERENIETKEN